MFVIDRGDIELILKDFGIYSEVKYVSEMRRYRYERNNPASKEVRLIVKVESESGPPLVVRFKNEADVTLEVIESQSSFADILRKNGIVTPLQFQTDGKFAKWCRINGYDVIVTVEQFAEGEIRAVDAGIAAKTGVLLAKTHHIAERNNLHVKNEVIFDPFSANDLFDFDSFQSLMPTLHGVELELFHAIVQKYDAHMKVLNPLKRRPRYAVQGDISNRNLYQTDVGEIGIFDFNRCGDNDLFCDAVMQAMFESRLMDYDENLNKCTEETILTSFLRGYCSVREFSEEERNLYPYLYAVIEAFWSSDIKWNKNSLMNAVQNGDREQVRERLETIWRRLTRPER